jgi:DNA-binding transcriptional MerR regulator
MRIAEFARRVGLSPDSVRRLERRGVISAARRDWVGHRRFTEDDVASVRKVLFGGACEESGKAASGDR